MRLLPATSWRLFVGQPVSADDANEETTHTTARYTRTGSQFFLPHADERASGWELVKGGRCTKNQYKHASTRRLLKRAVWSAGRGNALGITRVNSKYRRNVPRESPGGRAKVAAYMMFSATESCDTSDAMSLWEGRVCDQTPPDSLQHRPSPTVVEKIECQIRSPLTTGVLKGYVSW